MNFKRCRRKPKHNTNKNNKDNPEFKMIRI